MTWSQSALSGPKVVGSSPVTATSATSSASFPSFMATLFTVAAQTTKAAIGAQSAPMTMALSNRLMPKSAHPAAQGLRPTVIPTAKVILLENLHII